MSKQYTFVIDLDQCIGCHACTIACKQENKVEPLQFWVRALQMGPIGKFPDLEMYFLPFLCQHCQEPACLYACPKGAIAKREADGIVIVDRERCQGQDKCATGDPCRIACPAKIDPEGYISLIAEGKPQEALQLFRNVTPFAGVLGRVCAHACETDCQRARYDEAVSIRALKRYMSDHELELGRKKATPAKTSKPDKVAVVGSGPAGLSCAYDLIRMGFPVTVFEAASEAGGLLRYGIPQYRLPNKVLDNEINYLKEKGVLVKTDNPVKSLDELSGQGFKSVFLATGAWRSQKLNVSGENAKGVIHALDFLNKVNSGGKLDLGKKVAVIGGGSVAIDSARIALRLGAEEVHLICLECRDLTSKDRMLAQASEIREAEEEGIVIHPSLGVHQILTKNGQVTGLEAMVCLSVRNQDGTFAPKFDDCNVSIITADSIIVAIGQALDKSTLPEGLKNITGNHIPVNPVTLETEMKGVFAGGDAVGMAGDVISAIAAGKRAAISIERYLSGIDLRQGRETITQNIEWVLNTGVQSKPRKIVPVLQAEKRKGFAEVELGFDEETAIEEARRCLRCGKCYKACPYGALSIGDNGGINKCTLCVDRIDAGLKPACLSVCPGSALHFGNLNDAESEVAKKIEAAGDKVHTLMDKGTHPSIRYILRRAEWREDIKYYNYQLDPIEGAGKFNE